MSANHATARRIVVLADREVAAVDAGDLSRIADAAAAGDVLIVAPAGPVAGERWIVDLTARSTQARERLDAWATLLASRARSVEVEIGDENPRFALADARREFRPDAVITLEPDPTPIARRTSVAARLLGGSGAVAQRRLPTAA